MNSFYPFTVTKWSESISEGVFLFFCNATFLQFHCYNYLRILIHYWKRPLMISNFRGDGRSNIVKNRRTSFLDDP